MKNLLSTVKDLFRGKTTTVNADLTSAASVQSGKHSKSKPVNLQFSSRARRTMEWSRYHIGGLH